MRERFQVVVVGGGASGTLVAAHYAGASPEGRLALIEASGVPSGGLAYSTPCEDHLLNVPAGKMSGLVDDPGHFHRWLRAHRPEAGEGAFVPRRLYGAYLASLLEGRSGGPTILQDSVMDLSRTGDGWDVRLGSGASLHAESVVLACGNLPPRIPAAWGSDGQRPPLHNPWDGGLALGLDPEGVVLLLGTGLTMVDAVLSLRAAGHRGPLIALSRKGRLPRPHLAFPTPPRVVQPGEADARSPRRTLSWLRREIACAADEGHDWRTVVDGLRPHTAAIWRRWTESGRASFLRHARSLWDVHRHRVAPQVQSRIAEWVEQGELRVERGRLEAARVGGEGIEVSWKRPGSGGTRRVIVARAVNCTGPDTDLGRSGPALLQSLRGAGWIRPDRLGLGLDTDPSGAILDAKGRVVPGLFALGPLCRPAHWESTAIPEIRGQAAALAARLRR